MNRAEKIVFFLAMLLWIVGDMITTWIALESGIVSGLGEANPITKDLFQMFLLKIGVMAFALFAIKYAEKNNYGLYKIPVYSAFMFVGTVAVINNIVQIIKVM